MYGAYLATESLRHTSCCVGSLNNSGITVKGCAGHSGLKSQSANISWGMRFEECLPRLWTAVGSERVSIHGRGIFSRTHQPSERKRKETLLAGNEDGYKIDKKWRKRTCRATVLLIKSFVFWTNRRSRIYCLINFLTPENTTLTSQDSWHEQLSLVYFVTAQRICKFVEQLWGLGWLHLVPLQTHEENLNKRPHKIHPIRGKLNSKYRKRVVA